MPDSRSRSRFSRGSPRVSRPVKRTRRGRSISSASSYSSSSGSRSSSRSTGRGHSPLRPMNEGALETMSMPPAPLVNPEGSSKGAGVVALKDDPVKAKKLRELALKVAPPTEGSEEDKVFWEELYSQGRLEHTFERDICALLWKTLKASEEVQRKKGPLPHDPSPSWPKENEVFQDSREMLLRLAHQLRLQPLTASKMLLDTMTAVAMRGGEGGGGAIRLDEEAFEMICCMVNQLKREKLESVKEAKEEVKMEETADDWDSLTLDEDEGGMKIEPPAPQDFHILVRKIYEEKNAAKLGDVPWIVEKYKKTLHALLDSLVKKYQVDLPHLVNTCLEESKRGYFLASAPSRQQWARDVLEEVYARCCPGKLPHVESLLLASQGKEGELVKEVREKYGRRDSKRRTPLGDAHYKKSAEQSEGVRTFQHMISEALAISNHDKLATLNQLFTKYEAREHYLYLAICDKYKLAVNAQAFSKAKAKMEKERQDCLEKDVEETLSTLFMRFSPSKSSDIPALLEKYKGRERLLIEMVCIKYKVPLHEKMGLLLKLDQQGVDCSWHPRFLDCMVRSGIAKNLTCLVATDSAAKDAPISEFEPSAAEAFLLPSVKETMRCAHVVVRGREVAKSDEEMRELVEKKARIIAAKVTRSSDAKVFVSCSRGVPEGELDPILVNGQQKFGCSLVVGSSEPGAVMKFLSEFASWMITYRIVVNSDYEKVIEIQQTQPIQHGATGTAQPRQLAHLLRAHFFLSDLGEGSFGLVGDYRHFIELSAPSAYRCRLSVWSGVGGSSMTALKKEMMPDGPKGPCVFWSRKMRQTSLWYDAEKKTLVLLGSGKHRSAFKKLKGEIDALLGSIPSRVLRLPEQLLKGQHPQAPSLIGPSGLLLPQLYDFSDGSEYHDSDDDLESDEAGDPTELNRPIRLSKPKMREAFLLGSLCLNCDDSEHKPTDCPIRRKVCWNCHGGHPGAACTYRCRMCKQNHFHYAILECVKKASGRYQRWLMSKAYKDQKSLRYVYDQLDSKLAEVSQGGAQDPGLLIYDMLKENSPQGFALRDFLSPLFKFLFDAQIVIPKKYFTTLEALFPERAALVQRPISLPTNPVQLTSESLPLPSEMPPPLPDPQRTWVEKIFLDGLLNRRLWGKDVSRMIIGKAGQNLKTLERLASGENAGRAVSILIRGIHSETNGGKGGAAKGDSDELRLHLAVFCSEAVQALRCKAGLRDLINDMDTQIENQEYAEPFRFLQLKGSESYVDRPIELDFAQADDLTQFRLWLSRQEVVSSIADDLGRHLKVQPVYSISPSPARIPEDLKENTFRMFQKILTDWTSPPPSAGGPYFFEDFELQGFSLFGVEDGGEGAGWAGDLDASVDSSGRRSTFFEGQRVTLSDAGAKHFAKILHQLDLEGLEDMELIQRLLRSFQGSIVKKAEGKELLHYLRYPWSLAGSDIPLQLQDDEADKALRRCGRLGVPPGSGVDILKMKKDKSVKEPPSGESKERPGDALLRRLAEDSVAEGEPPFSGYIVAWMSPAEAPYAPPAETEPPTPKASDLAGFGRLSAEVLMRKLKKRNLPTHGRKVDLMERLRLSLAAPPPALSRTGPFRCRVELPAEVVSWPSLSQKLMGPQNSHFKHVERTHPETSVTLQGSPSPALMGEARLHLLLTGTGGCLEETFLKAKGSVLDLVSVIVKLASDGLGLSYEECKKKISCVDLQVGKDNMSFASLMTAIQEIKK